MFAFWVAAYFAAIILGHWLAERARARRIKRRVDNKPIFWIDGRAVTIRELEQAIRDGATCHARDGVS